MKLLKIGRLANPVGRWRDALQCFDEISVLKLYRDEEEDASFNYLDIPNNFCLRVLAKLCSMWNENRSLKWLLDLTFFVLRYPATTKIRPLLKKCEYDFVHVSYNDFDESALLLILIHPFLKKGAPIIRSYKESRPEWKYAEYMAFALSDRIVLNENENISFFERKYGSSIFQGKTVLTGLDEDAIGEEYVNRIEYLPKLSSVDNRKHLVILCGRAFSDSLDPRSGSRLFYVDLIKEFLKAGFVVHLHTLRIIPDINGVNQYEVLRQNYVDSFFIESPLSFDDDHFVDSYKVLSRYDFGVLHNFVEGTPNTEFDKYNIPHRYYEYELAHVTPILLRGKTIVMQRIMEEKKTGIVYSKPEEIVLSNQINYNISVFSDYIKSLYQN